jgi:hypothetical protein
MSAAVAIRHLIVSQWPVVCLPLSVRIRNGLRWPGCHHTNCLTNYDQQRSTPITTAASTCQFYPHCHGVALFWVAYASPMGVRAVDCSLLYFFLLCFCGSLLYFVLLCFKFDY